MRVVTLYFTELHYSTSIHYFHKQHICRFNYRKLFTMNNFILNIILFYLFVQYVHKRSNHAEPTQASLQFSLQDCFCNPLEPLCSKYDCCINNTCVKFAACWQFCWQESSGVGGLEDRDRPQLLSFKSNTDFIKHLLVLKKKRTNIKRCFYVTIFSNENVYDNFYFFCYISLQHLIIYITVNVTVIICFGV